MPPRFSYNTELTLGVNAPFNMKFGATQNHLLSAGKKWLKKNWLIFLQIWKILPVFSKHKFKQKKWDNFWNLKTHSQKQIVGRNNSSKKVIKSLPIQALHILQQDYKTPTTRETEEGE